MKQTMGYLTTQLFAKLFLVIGALNYIFLAFNNKNAFEYIPFKNARMIIYALIGLSGLLFVFDRNYYLPFLGPAAVPIKRKENSEGKQKIKTILKNLPPNVDVIYWAASSDEKGASDPYIAYGNYSNSGSSSSNEKGEAEIEYECPIEYQVTKFGLKRKLIPKHIHYRYALPEANGLLLSQVYTKFLDINCQ